MARTLKHQQMPRVVIKDDEKLVFVNGKEVHFTLKEYKLLKTIKDGRGKVFTRDELLERIWASAVGDYVEVDTRTVDQHVARMRPLIGARIQARVGFGYRWNGK